MLLKGGDGGTDLDALSDLLNNLRNEFDDKYATKDSLNDLTDRVAKLEEDYGQLSETSEQHTTDIEDLKNRKVDKDVFDAEISFIKNVLNSKGGEKIEMPVSSGEPSAELLARLKAVEKDVDHIKDELKNVNLGQLADMLKALEKKLEEKADKSDLGPIKDTLNLLKDLLDKLEKEIGYLKAAGADTGQTTINGDVLVDITNKIGKIELRLDGIDKKLANLARANAAKTVNNNDGANNGVDEA